MRVSIIIPAYNASRYLAQTIEGVLAQTIGDWELVVVDDGSVDGTAELAASYAAREPRVRLVSQQNAGLARARNRGFAEASPCAAYVSFLDADDVWEADALHVLARRLDAQPEALAVHGLARLMSADGEPWRPGELEMWARLRRGVGDRGLVSWPLRAPTAFGVLAYRNVIPTAGTVLLRRGALQKVGLFDPATAPCEDWDMWLRLSARADILFEDRVVLNYRIHGGNMVRDEARMDAGMAYVRWKIISSQELDPARRRIAARANRLWTLQRGSLELKEARAELSRRDARAAAHRLARAVGAYMRWCRGVPVP